MNDALISGPITETEVRPTKVCAAVNLLSVPVYAAGPSPALSRASLALFEEMKIAEESWLLTCGGSGIEELSFKEI